MPIIDRRGAAIISIIFVTLALAVAIPPFIESAGDLSERSVTQTEGSEIGLTGHLSADLTSVQQGQVVTTLESIHQDDTDFGGATTLENMSISGTGDSAFISLDSNGDGTTELDSFEDQSLSEYSSTGNFDTTTNRAFDGSVSVTKTAGGGGHDWMYRSSSQFTSGENITVSIRWYYDGNSERGGPMLATSGGGGYAAFLDANPSGGTTLLIRDAPSDTDSGEFIASESITGITSQGWYQIYIRHDGSQINSWVEDSNGDKLGEVVAADATHSPDRTGVWAFDTGIEMDYIIQHGTGGGAQRGVYVSRTHQVDGSTTGFTNLTVDNSSAIVTWLADGDNDGTFETTVDQSEYTTAGNKTADLSGESASAYRVNVTYSVDGTEPTGRLDDEGILFDQSQATGINVTLIDDETGETVETGNINQSEERTFVIGGEDVTITNQNVLSDDRSLITYEYPTYYGMGSGVEAIMTNAPLIALALGFIIVVLGIYAGRGV